MDRYQGHVHPRWARAWTSATRAAVLTVVLAATSYANNPSPTQVSSGAPTGSVATHAVDAGEFAAAIDAGTHLRANVKDIKPWIRGAAILRLPTPS